MIGSFSKKKNGLRDNVKSPFFNLILSMPIMRKHLEIPNFQLNVCILLTANIFESGPMPTP
jgi:hypothetical protein